MLKSVVSANPEIGIIHFRGTWPHLKEAILLYRLPSIKKPLFFIFCFAIIFNAKETLGYTEDFLPLIFNSKGTLGYTEGSVSYTYVSMHHTIPDSLGH